jgi:hypothetical protein
MPGPQDQKSQKSDNNLSHGHRSRNIEHFQFKTGVKVQSTAPQLSYFVQDSKYPLISDSLPYCTLAATGSSSLPAQG